MTDARSLSDRELLLQVYDDMQEMKRDLLGSAGFIDTTRDRLAVLETKIDERTTKRAQAYGIPAGVSALGILVWEIVKSKMNVG